MSTHDAIPESGTNSLLPDDWFEAFRGWVRERLALDFPDARRVNLSNGIARAMYESKARDFAQYWEWLNNPLTQPLELDRLARLLTVTETHFFRDQALMDALRTKILPDLIARHPDRTLDIWSAGCATGEEPYSLAMLLADLVPADWNITLYGTDVNSAALNQAREGSYRANVLRAVSPQNRERFFVPQTDGTFCLTDSIRERVRFSTLNLISPLYPSPFDRNNYFDLIICRNVLIYFADPQAVVALSHLHRALAPDGYFISGQIEPISRLNSGFGMVRIGDTLLYRKTSLPTTPAIPPSTPPTPRVALELTRPRPVTHTLPHAALSSVKQRDITSTLNLYEQALRQANAGAWDAALLLCTQALTASPSDYKVYQLLALIYSAHGEFSAAREELRRAIYLAPGAPLSYFYLANVYRQLQDMRELRNWATLTALLKPKAAAEVVSDDPEITVGYLRSLIAAQLMGKPV